MSTDNEVLISVVIASYNGADYITRCLESLTTQSLEDNRFEVIVVDNNSTDTTRSTVTGFIQDLSNFHLEVETRQGVSYARNKGIAEAKGKYVCFIDDDAYASDEWLEKILHSFEKITPVPAVIGGTILPYYISEKPGWFSDDLETRTKGDKSRFLSDREAPFGFPESNYSVRADILSEIGVFSPSYGPQGDRMAFGEGADLSRRIAAKYPLFWYDPSITVYHLVPEKNMGIRYILGRKYETAQRWQSFSSRNSGVLANLFTFAQCSVRALLSVLFSIILVRWFTKRMIADWLKQAINLTNCTARSIYLLKIVFGLRKP
jgi:glycosyltransferase involved in cell wall biosynthesis